MNAVAIDTPHGPAHVHLHCAPAGRGALLLGHGAGGGTDAPDLVAAARAAYGAGVHVGLVEQPYRVVGRRAPEPAHHLDAAFLAVADELASRRFDGVPMIFGGRSSGGAGRLPHAGRRPGGRGAVPGVSAAPAGASGEIPAGRARRRGCAYADRPG